MHGAAHDALALLGPTPAAAPAPPDERDTVYLERQLRSEDPRARQRAKLAVRALMVERLRCPTALRRGDAN